MPSLYSNLFYLILASTVTAQAIYTETWADGEELIVSTGTDALGVPQTRTLSTLIGPSDIASATSSTGLASLSSISSTSAPASITSERTTLTTPTTTTTPTRPAVTTPDADVQPTMTTRGRVQDTSLPPAQTYTYWFQDQEYVWIAPVTTIPTVATAVVPAGTPMQYTQYQSVVNNRVFESAQANADGQANANGAESSMSKGVGYAMAAGGVVAGMGLVAWL